MSWGLLTKHCNGLNSKMCSCTALEARSLGVSGPGSQMTADIFLASPGFCEGCCYFLLLLGSVFYILSFLHSLF